MVYIKLFHGRKAVDEKLEDWGECGPVLGPFRYCHITYMSTELKLNYEGEDCWINIIGDLVFYDGMYYGDISIISKDVLDDSEDLQSRLEPFSEGKTHPENTEIVYFYRDASNYKTQPQTAILAGPMTEEQKAEIRDCFDEGRWFIASQLGLEDAIHKFFEKGYGLNDEDDHVYSELCDDSFKSTTKTPLNISVDEFMGKVRKAKKRGWDVPAAMARLGLEV
jgi:hypothetical protein